jgi:hypothetical protein
MNPKCAKQARAIPTASDTTSHSSKALNSKFTLLNNSPFQRCCPAELTVPQSSEAVLAKVREMELPTIERQDNCQVAVSLSLANDQASLPVYGCLCHRNGRAMTNVCARRRFLTTSPSRSNTRLRSIGYAGLRDWSAARRGADGGRLWQQQRAARPNYGAGSDLRCGHSVGYHSMVS